MATIEDDPTLGEQLRSPSMRLRRFVGVSALLMVGIAPVGLAVTAGQIMNHAPESVATMQMTTDAEALDTGSRDSPGAVARIAGGPEAVWQAAPTAATKAPESDDAHHRAVDAAAERVNEMDEQLAPDKEETRVEDDERSEHVQPPNKKLSVTKNMHAATQGRSEILGWTPIAQADFAPHGPVAQR